MVDDIRQGGGNSLIIETMMDEAPKRRGRSVHPRPH
jgi:hypothetical protein